MMALSQKLKIRNVIFEKGEIPNDFRETLIKPLYKKGDNSECHNYRGISLVSVDQKEHVAVEC